MKKNDAWTTPDDFFKKQNDIWNFTIDLAASKENTKCNRFYDKEDNSLEKSWAGEIGWLNPPYSEIELWVKKANEEAKHAFIVALVFAKTDTKWFHNYVYKKWEIEFIKGRLKFGDGKNPAPYGSMLIYFGDYDRRMVQNKRSSSSS